MIQPGDLTRPATLQVHDGYRRTWKTLWRRRPIRRTVWAGYIEHYTRGLNGTTRIELVDTLTRVQDKWHA